LYWTMRYLRKRLKLNNMLEPIFTEKSLREAKAGNYSFKVTGSLDKKQVASEIARLFGVKVVSVRVSKIGAESGRNARGRKFAKAGVKKAIVTLKSGDKIDIFEEGKK
jgi:large subunit ribosomal protein L23